MRAVFLANIGECFMQFEPIYLYLKSRGDEVLLVAYDLQGDKWKHSTPISSLFKEKHYPFIYGNEFNRRSSYPFDFSFIAAQYPECAPGLSVGRLAAQTKIVWIGYGYTVLPFTIPPERTSPISLVFAENETAKSYLQTKFSKDAQIVVTGYSKFANYSLPPLGLQGESDSAWSKGKPLKLLYTPRWYKEHGTCSYDDICPALIQMAKEYPAIHLIFRFHPLVRYDISQALEAVKGLSNVSIHKEPNYFPLLEEIDVLISDPSTLVGEFFYLNKPLILTKHNSCPFTPFGEILKGGCYLGDDSKAVQTVLHNLLEGKDFLASRRKTICKTYYSCYPDPVQSIVKTLDSMTPEGK
jgi:hypothetical protein